MNEPILLLRVERDEDGDLRVLAPGVGMWSDLPDPGALIGPGSSVGTLAVLHRRFRMILPEGAAGTVGGGVPRERVVAVEHGQPLFRLRPLTHGMQIADAGQRGAAGGSAVSGLPEGARAIVSPTDGVFYRRPSPDAPPFVEAGTRIHDGQAVGLVEVMKTFNQIVYGGPGWPDEATVIEIRCSDVEEVAAGQILVVVR